MSFINVVFKYKRNVIYIFEFWKFKNILKFYYMLRIFWKFRENIGVLVKSKILVFFYILRCFGFD